MKKRAKISLVAAALTLSIVTLSACGGGTPSAGAPAGQASGQKMYISVIAKGFQHQFWQTVKQGSEQAGKDLNVDVNFTGPEGESAISTQVTMINQELAKKPAAMCLAALDTKSVLDQLKAAADAKIPVIGFDSGVPDAPAGQIAATAATNNEAAAAIAADHMYDALKAKIDAATPSNQIVIKVLSQDATSASVTGRTRGFAKEMAKKVGANAAVTGGQSDVNTGSASSAGVIIDVVIGATPDITDMTTAASGLLNTKGLAGIFLSNEGSVSGLLAAENAGSSVAPDVVIIGFDAGKAQKAAVKSGAFLGAITQDPYQIGYKAVSMAVAAAKGQPVADVDTGAKWYDKTNMDQPDIAKLLYD